jgi:cytochrome c oxidase subunit III
LSDALTTTPHEHEHDAHGDHAHPRFVHHFANLREQKDAAGLGMWLFLAQEIMFFGGLFFVYTLYRNLYHGAFVWGSHQLNWKLGAFNTVVLIGSSLTMALAVHAAAQGKRKQIVGWLVATILLGTLFLGVKVVEYREKFHHNLVPGASFAQPYEGMDPHHAVPQALRHNAEIYFSLYFAMTGLHALHMIIGIPILAGIAFFAWRGEYSERFHTPVEMLGLYWHFVDIVWIFLFPLLYLIA